MAEHTKLRNKSDAILMTIIIVGFFCFFCIDVKFSHSHGFESYLFEAYVATLALSSSYWCRNVRFANVAATIAISTATVIPFLNPQARNTLYDNLVNGDQLLTNGHLLGSMSFVFVLNILIGLITFVIVYSKVPNRVIVYVLLLDFIYFSFLPPYIWDDLF